MEKKLQKPYPTDYDLLKAQDLWQVHYQILLIILLNNIKKLKVNLDNMKKNMKLAELYTKILTPSLNTQTLKKI